MSKLNALFPELQDQVERSRKQEISNPRKEILQGLIDYLQSKVDNKETIRLNFICTHNSRRSQFSQIWAHVAAFVFNVPTVCYSGGVEVTAFNQRAVESIKRSGFRVEAEVVSNPLYRLFFSSEAEPIRAFSKLYNDEENKADKFAAVMTCSHADENCPIIPGAEQRISVNYQDPKAFDDTPQESMKYDERSLQIASEMFFVFSQVETNI